MPRPGYDWFRRIVAPLALVGALALLVQDTCRERDRAPVTLELDVGGAAARIRHVRVDLWAGDASVGYFERAFPGGVTAPVRWAQPLPTDTIDATLAVTLDDGTVVPLRRTLTTPPGARVTLNASPE